MIYWPGLQEIAFVYFLGWLALCQPLVPEMVYCLGRGYAIAPCALVPMALEISLIWMEVYVVYCFSCGKDLVGVSAVIADRFPVVVVPPRGRGCVRAPLVPLLGP